MEHSHSHSHNHNHGHHHHHTVDIKQVNRAFVIGIVLNFLFVVIEVIVGLNIHSLSLLSDAGHNLGDVASLSMSLVALRLMKVKANERFTYGYKKTTILVALLNAAILLISIGAISYEAFHKLFAPEPLPGKTISIVAAIGIVINTITALLFFHNKESDLNIKSAFLHLLSDAIISAGIVIGGIIIFYTNLFWIDAVLSIVLAIVILISTWKLLKDSLRLSLDGVPENVDMNDIKTHINKINGVKDFHHIHVWALSTTENALTGHIVVAKETDMNSIERIKHDVKHELEHLNVKHATLEVEMENVPCEEQDC
ncbi:MAG TPA: cation diffusion facilitator family transporter [Puia sp.]|nr:cation diffusion facilitator family transporter [Puia sp.]